MQAIVHGRKQTAIEAETQVHWWWVDQVTKILSLGLPCTGIGARLNYCRDEGQGGADVDVSRNGAEGSHKK